MIDDQPVAPPAAPAGARWWRAVGVVSAVAGMAFFAGLVAGWLVVEPTFTSDDLVGGSATAGSVARNNVTVGLAMLALGAVTASLGAIALLALNGLLVGQLLGALLESGEAEVLVTGLVPHAVLEVPGFVALIAASALPGVAVVRRLAGRAQPREWIEATLACLTIVGVGIALLVVASFIEDAISVVALTEIS